MFDKFQNVGNLNILVIGDIILDKYIHGKTDRISPEAPVPVVNILNESYVLGGAANVAVNLKSLGAKCYLVGLIGDDKNGNIIRNLIREQLADAAVLLVTDKRTTSKTRIVAKGQQLLRIDEEDTYYLSNEDEENLIHETARLLNNKEFQGIILQDYNKGIFSKNVINHIIALANSKNIPVFVDPKHNNFWAYKQVEVFKPNLSELLEANKVKDSYHLEELLVKAYKKLECKLLFCTLAEKGNAFVQDNMVTFVPTQKIEVLDVSGAGDSSLAIIVLSYVLGYEASAIAKLANICGKVACLKKGVSAVSLNDIQQAFSDAIK